MQPYALHGYKSLYVHPDLEYDITYLHGIWLLVRTIVHDLHASVVVASYTLRISRLTIVSREAKKKAGRTRRMSVLFTGSTGVKFVNALNKPPLKLSLSYQGLSTF